MSFCCEQADLAKAKDELAKAKEEVLTLKQQSQAKAKASKEEDKAKAKTASQIASLERDKERLTAEVRTKSRDLERQHDRAETLEKDIEDLKTTLERANVRAQAHQMVRKNRDFLDYDDDDESFEVVQPVRKRVKPSTQPSAQVHAPAPAQVHAPAPVQVHAQVHSQSSIEATIQQQVAEVLKRMLPPGMLPQQQAHTTIPPPVHQYPYVAREPLYDFASESISHVPPPLVRPTQMYSYQDATPPPSQTSSSTIWPSQHLNLSHDTPLSAALSTPFGFASSASAKTKSPVSEPKPEATPETTNAEMFQAFMDFMKSKKN